MTSIVRASSPCRSSPRWRRAFATAAVGLIAAGCAAGSSPSAGMNGRASESPTAPVTVASIAPSLVQPTPSSAEASPASEAWSPVPDQDSVRGVQLEDVVWTGTRFVAVGAALEGGGAFLDSLDGISWHRQAAPGQDASPTRLAAGPYGVVAVGTIGERQASWSSSDGLVWTVRSDAFAASPSGSDTILVTDIVASPDGWLAVGREDPVCNVDCGLDPVRALAWRSADGLRWERVPDQPSLDRGGMNSVTRHGSVFVAAGAASRDAAVWTSPDGSTWSRVPAAPTFHAEPGGDSSTSVAILGVASGHGVVVVTGIAFGVGFEGSSAVRAWWSTDGRTWTEAAVEGASAGQAFSVASVPDGFLATGPSGERSCLGGIWSSTDGRTWRCIASGPGFAGFGPYSASSSATIEIAAGLTSAGWDESTGQGLPSAVWWRAIP